MLNAASPTFVTVIVLVTPVPFTTPSPKLRALALKSAAESTAQPSMPKVNVELLSALLVTVTIPCFCPEVMGENVTVTTSVPPPEERMVLVGLRSDHRRRTQLLTLGGC
jgi:hypothetical protein